MAFSITRRPPTKKELRRSLDTLANPWAAVVGVLAVLGVLSQSFEEIAKTLSEHGGRWSQIALAGGLAVLLLGAGFFLAWKGVRASLKYKPPVSIPALSSQTEAKFAVDEMVLDADACWQVGPAKDRWVMMLLRVEPGVFVFLHVRRAKDAVLHSSFPADWSVKRSAAMPLILEHTPGERRIPIRATVMGRVLVTTPTMGALRSAPTLDLVRMEELPAVLQEMLAA